MTLLVHQLSTRPVNASGVKICFSVVCLVLVPLLAKRRRICGVVGFSWRSSLVPLVDDLVDGGLLVARPGHDVFIVGRDITA